MTNADISEIIAPHSAEVQKVVHALRALVRTAIPDCTEKAYLGWHALGFRHPDAGYFCGIFPYDDHVHLLFERGARLPDPNSLLEGSHLKQVRFVRVEPGQDLRVAALTELLLAAVHAGALRAAKPARAKSRRARK